MSSWAGRVVRWCWVNFQCRGVLLIWIRVGQGPTALAVGAGGGCLDIFSLVYNFSFLSPSLWETARYRLKYCLKGPLSPKQATNQPVVRPSVLHPSTISNNFSSETTGPIATKFHIQPPGPLGKKNCSNGLGHMTNMATMPIHDKNLKKSFFSSPEP